MRRLTQEEFIEKAKCVHDNLYDYSLVNFINTRTKVKIICSVHGVFEQQPNNHLTGKNCKKCSLNIISKNKTADTKYFINKAKDLHGDRYDYSKVDYKNNHDKIKIICKEHGEFEQRPKLHLQGNNCPKCNPNLSVPEEEIANFVEELGFRVIRNNRKILKGKEIDIFIPDIKIGIEFNGNYWHYHKDKFVSGRHALKSNLCREQGIKLLHIREDLWLNNKIRMKKVVEIFLELNANRMNNI